LLSFLGNPVNCGFTDPAKQFPIYFHYLWLIIRRAFPENCSEHPLPAAVPRSGLLRKPRKPSSRLITLYHNEDGHRQARTQVAQVGDGSCLLSFPENPAYSGFTDSIEQFSDLLWQAGTVPACYPFPRILLTLVSLTPSNSSPICFKVRDGASGDGSCLLSFPKNPAYSGFTDSVEQFSDLL
jgi:hypothetical protein